MIREWLQRFAHTLCVELDAGGQLDGLSVVDAETGEPQGPALGERFVAYMYDTGRAR